MNDDELMYDDLDDFEEQAEDTSPQSEEVATDLAEESTLQEEKEEEDYITSLLKTKGIEDRSKIKFETESGEIEERNWDDLSNQDRFNILNQHDEPETGLDESEIQLINAIRNSGLSTQDYIQYIQQNAVNIFAQNNQEPQYSVDQYTNDELFVADLLGRMGDNITEDEALAELERVKANPELFEKQMNAIRNEYKTIESENIQQQQLQLQYEAQELFERFSNEIANQIVDFTEFLGYDVALAQDDVDQLYEFITGVDAAGNNHFAKALMDPKTLVLTAWLALNGKQMIDDITTYFTQEISKVSKESYKKGVEDTNKKNQKSDVVYKPKASKPSKKNEVYEDLDDF